MKALLRSLAVLVLGTAAFAAPLRAATLTWSGTAPATSGTVGGTGAWDTSGLNWWTGNGAAAWNNANNDTAAFAGTSGTVTLGTNITAGGLSFNTSSGYLLNLGANTLTLGAATNSLSFNFNATGGVTGTISGLVTGTGNVLLGGGPLSAGVYASTLNLIGTATGGWSGTTTITQGQTLAISATNQALRNTAGITLTNGNITITTASNTAGLDRISNTATIGVNTGSFSWTTVNNAQVYAETTGTIALGRGEFLANLGVTQATGTQTLTLSGLTRTGNTASVQFAGSGAPLDTTRNRIVVTGATGSGTNAGPIIGPWATVGTDYAVYDGSGNVLAANIASSDQSTWSTAANAYTSSTTGAGQTLTGKRTITALRLSGTVAANTTGTALNLGNFNLETNGIQALVFNGTSTLSVVAGSGVITTPTGGGNLFIATSIAPIGAPGGTTDASIGTNRFQIAAPITDNAGAVTVVKTGPGVLELTGSNSFSGGIVLNAGRIAYASDAALGASSGGITVNGIAQIDVTNGIAAGRTITVNDGGVLGVWAPNQQTTIRDVAAAVTGNGTLRAVMPTIGMVQFSSASNTFSGPVVIDPVGNGFFFFASLADGADAQPVFVGTRASNGTGRFVWTGGTKTFSNRQFALITSNANVNAPGMIANNGTGPLTITKDLAIANNNSRLFALGGTSTGFSNEFAGRIGDPLGASLNVRIGHGTNVANITDAATWILSATNTYTGTTTIVYGELAISSDANISGTASPLTFSGGAASAVPTLKILGTGLTSLNPNRLTTFTADRNVGFNIDDVANTFTVSQPINSGSGGLTKTGRGTLSLTGTSSYSGVTNVSGGVLLLSTTSAVSGTAARPYTVNAAGVLAAGYALDQSLLDKTATASAGVIALAAGGTNATNLSFSSLTAASLGAAGSGTQSYTGTLTPNGTTYRLGGGGGTLDFQSLLSGGNTLTAGGNTAGLGGTVLLSNDANSFTGKTTVQMGTLAFSSIANVSGGSSALGAPATTSDGTIDLGSGTIPATLRYVGSGTSSSNRTIMLSGTSGGGGVIEAAGAGALLLTGTVSGAEGNKTFTLGGTSTALNTIGLISGTGVSVAKDGTGLWRMDAASKGFGGTLTVKNGTLQVANAGAVGSTVTVGDTAPVASGVAALLLEENVSASLDVITPAGTQAALFGGANTTGTATFSNGEMQMGRATTLVAKTGGTVDFRGTWAGATTGTPADQDVTIGAVGYAGRFLLKSSGTLATSGSVAVQYGTAVLGLTTRVSAAGTLTTDSGATLAGTGFVTNAIGGAGLISPGNSPGILTAGSLDPSAETDFIFEITGAAPDFNNRAASINDVLRLTGTNPFASALGAGNVVNVLFNLSSGTAPVTAGTYTGGFFTDLNTNFSASISSGSFAYWVLGAYGSGSSQQQFAVGPDGSLLTYSRLEAFDASLSVQKSVVPQTGTVTGQITQFVVVPEPATIALAGIGAALAGWRVVRWRRRR
jgi:autotransporter-associated beta strand protein